MQNDQTLTRQRNANRRTVFLEKRDYCKNSFEDFLAAIPASMAE